MSHDAEGRAQLRSYYEREAELELRTGARGERVELRTTFIDSLAAEGRRSVVDFGCGPGHDGAAFAAAGLRFVGLDLAVGNARQGASNGLHIVPASIDSPPLRERSFDAGWSMSTLMHLTGAEAAAAAAAMGSCLIGGAPLVVGLWGGPGRSETEHSLIEGERRPFHLRTAAQNQQVLESAGEIESMSTWSAGPEDWEYQVFRVRIAV